MTTLSDIRFNRIMKFVNKLNKLQENDINLDIIKFIMNEWKIIFKQQLLNFGWKFNKTVLNDLYEWGSNGYNWIKLHSNNKQDEYDTIKEYISKFSGELEYCSDRMSIDRLFRCHWEYNNLLEGYIKLKKHKTYTYKNLVFKNKIYHISDYFSKRKPNHILLCNKCFDNIKNDEIKSQIINFEHNNYYYCELCDTKNHPIYKLTIPYKDIKNVKLILFFYIEII